MVYTKYDLHCVLREVKTGREVLKFRARHMSNYAETGGFAGGGIASTGQTFSIAADRVFDCVPYNFKVYVAEMGLEFILAARRPERRKRLGESFCAEGRYELVLDLE